jgi:hypothetical protein
LIPDFMISLNKNRCHTSLDTPTIRTAESLVK